MRTFLCKSEKYVSTWFNQLAWTTEVVAAILMLADGVEVRVHGVVQVNTSLTAGVVVPIGWVAVGDPAQVLPPDRHDDIWAVQEGLDFPGTVYGVGRDTAARERMER